MIRLLTLLFAIAATAVAENTYMVLSPHNVRAGSVLTVPVHFLRPVTRQTVTAKLVDYDSDSVIASGQKYEPNEVKAMTVEILVPTTIRNWQHFRLNVTGTGTVTFKNSTSMWGRTKYMSIFVQTDKAVYKPGDKVKYRIFTTNGALDLVYPTLDVEFLDPKDNKIDEQMRVSGKYGISGELELSDMPPLGQWKIRVKVSRNNSLSVLDRYDETETRYYFEVKEYVLPKYEVKVEIPTQGSHDDLSLKGKVKAAYTFGKPVIGNLIVSVSKPWSSGFFDASAITKEMPIGGEATFEFPMSALKRLTRDMRYQTLVVTAKVTETITGITLTGEAQIRYREEKYSIEFHPNLPNNFKPAFNPYKVMLKVTQQDGRPPTGTTEQVDITVTYFTDRPALGPLPNSISTPGFEVESPFILGETVMLRTKTFPIREDGTVEFDLTIPENAATGSIKAEYMGESAYKDIQRFRTSGDVHMKAEILNTEALKIGDMVRLKLTSSEGPVTATYIVTTKDVLVESKEVRITDTKEGMDTFRVTRDMAPSAKLVAYYIRSDGEIIADGINFIVDDIYENKVSIEFDPTLPPTVEPKRDVTLRVTADPKSMVNVLVVDKSVKLLREGNDITRERIERELRRYGDMPYFVRGWGRIAPWSFSADDPYDVFNNAKMNVMTDANLHSFNLWSSERRYRYSSAPGPYLRSGFVNYDTLEMKQGKYIPSLPQGQVRKHFPETFMWLSAMATDGEALFTAKVPDTITEYVANAYALNPETGLGVATTTSNLTVFLPFFVSTALPYSVIRGETAVIQANVFNYHPEDLYVEVKLEGSSEFVGISVDPTDKTETEIEGDLKKCILAQSGRATPVFFNVKPKIVGSMTVKIRAEERNTRNIYDEVIKNLRVKAEGKRKEKNHPILLSLRRGSTTKTTKIDTAIEYPPEVTVPQSQKIRVTVINDIFGPSLKNLDKLIELPYGCGEQNMLRFAPSVFAAIYMKQTRRFETDTTLQDKIRRVLRTGYQRQLNYQRYDGSFSAFGDADDEGSLWLTAFVAKSFAQAKAHDLTFIDHRVMKKAVKYIIDNQNREGDFNMTGLVSNKAMQGGSASSKRSLTAYVLVALQEVKDAEILKEREDIEKLDAAIRLATDFLGRNTRLMTTDYEHAIGAYAFGFVRMSTHRDYLLDKLERSENRTDERNSRHWDNPSYSLEIETAAYALQAYTSKDDMNNAVKILYWLIDKRNPYGGYSSTMDTVVALRALSDFAAKVDTKDVKMTLDITTTKGSTVSRKTTIELDMAKKDILQYADFDGDVDTVSVEAKGYGLAMVDVNMFYNAIAEPDTQSYVVTVDTVEETTMKYTLKVCARFNKDAETSNMAMMDIGFVSGFEPIVDQILRTRIMKRVERSSGRLYIYFDEIPKTDTCVTIPAQRVAVVSGVKKANVMVYSYYEPRERIMKEYIPRNLETTKLCDLCGAECGCLPDPHTAPLTQCGTI